MDFETPFQRCVADCSVGGPGNEWKFVVGGILGLILLGIGCSIMSQLTAVGQARGKGGGIGMMNLLLIGAILVGCIAFLVPTFVAVEVTGVDQNKCNKECAHLIPAKAQKR